jgi:hypothetical protein
MRGFGIGMEISAMSAVAAMLAARPVVYPREWRR